MNGADHSESTSSSYPSPPLLSVSIASADSESVAGSVVNSDWIAGLPAEAGHVTCVSQFKELTELLA